MDTFIDKCFNSLSSNFPEKFLDGLQKSTITDKDIHVAEENLGYRFPTIFKDFLKSYVCPFMCLYGKFSGYSARRGLTYSVEDEEYKYIEDKLPFSVIKLQLEGFPKEPEKIAEYIELVTWNEAAQFGYLYIGEFYGDYQLFYNLITDEIIQIDHEETPFPPQAQDDMEEYAIVLFKSFTDFLRCFFLGDIYNEDTLEFEEGRET